MIEDKQFLKIINLTPLVSIDFIIKNQKGNFLLGKRTNRPAQNFWFVPGGIIRKNETITKAIERISLAELGTTLLITDVQLSGTFDHIYHDNFAGVEGINTHYVVLAYKITIADNIEIVRDDQHSEIKWWSKNELLNAHDVHENTKAYFTHM